MLQGSGALPEGQLQRFYHPRMVAESLVHLLGTHAAAAEACVLFALLLPAVSASGIYVRQLSTAGLKFTKLYRLAQICSQSAWSIGSTVVMATFADHVPW